MKSDFSAVCFSAPTYSKVGSLAFLWTARQYHSLFMLGLGFIGSLATIRVIHHNGKSKFPLPSLNRERYSVLWYCWAGLIYSVKSSGCMWEHGTWNETWNGTWSGMWNGSKMWNQSKVGLIVVGINWSRHEPAPYSLRTLIESHILWQTACSCSPYNVLQSSTATIVADRPPTHHPVWCGRLSVPCAAWQCNYCTKSLSVWEYR